MQFRIVVAARALIGIGPAVIENIFALRMRFRIAGGCPDELSAGFLRQEMHGLPSGTVADRARKFKGGEKVV